MYEDWAIDYDKVCMKYVKGPIAHRLLRLRGGGGGVRGGVQFSKRLDFGRSILKMHRMWGGSKY